MIKRPQTDIPVTFLPALIFSNDQRFSCRNENCDKRSKKLISKVTPILGGRMLCATWDRTLPTLDLLTQGHITQRLLDRDAVTITDGMYCPGSMTHWPELKYIFR
jgi:hypothetical protein